MQMRRFTWLALVLSMGVIAAACGGDDEGEGSADGGGTLQVAGEEANDHGTADVSGESATELELDDFYFEPTVLTGEAGQTLTISLGNEGNAAHTFTIDGLAVDVELQPGETAEAEVTFPDSGALLFYCRFHAGQGMRGGLQVP